MGNSVKEVSAEVSTEYKHLFDIGNRVQQNKTREIDTIIYLVCSQDRENQLGRKWAHVNTRLIEQDAQTAASEGKGKALRSTLGLLLDGASVAVSVAAAFNGGPNTPVGAGLSAIGHAFSSTSGYRTKTIEAEVDHLNHRYQCTASLIGDHGQEVQKADREHDQDSSTIDRIMQTSHRSFELIASNSSS